MSTDLTACPNCGTPLEGGLFGGVEMLNEHHVAIINEYNEPKKTAYCNKCGSKLYGASLLNLPMN